MRLLSPHSFYLVAFLMLFSCVKNNSPEASLRRFIDYRYSNNQDKEKVISMITSPLKEAIEGLSDNEFQVFLKTKHLEMKKFRVIHSNCPDETRCFITYEIKYDTLGEDQGADFRSEIKKIAQLDQVEGSWKIADVNNVKTFHDAQNAIEP